MNKYPINPKVDSFFTTPSPWQAEYAQLRTIALNSGLTEGLKWGQACYMLDNSNVVLIHGFKEYCAFLFFKGALMKDPKGVLVQPTENVQASRQVRFTNVKEIVKLAPTLKAYIKEAIAIEKAGLKVELKKTADFAMPDEFKQRLGKSAALKKAFEALTPGRQRAYLLHFAGAKQAATRVARIEKYVPVIMKGKGILDK